MKNFIITVLAVAVTLAGYEWYRSAQTKKYISAAYVSEGMMLASNTKKHVAAYYQTHDKLPSSNADLGLPPPDKYVGQSVSALEVGAAGVITVRFNEKSGVNGGTLQFTPDLSKPHMGISWACTTRSFVGIEAWAPQCKFVG